MEPHAEFSAAAASGVYEEHAYDIFHAMLPVWRAAMSISPTPAWRWIPWLNGHLKHPAGSCRFSPSAQLSQSQTPLPAANQNALPDETARRQPMAPLPFRGHAAIREKSRSHSRRSASPTSFMESTWQGSIPPSGRAHATPSVNSGKSPTTRPSPSLSATTGGLQGRAGCHPRPAASAQGAGETHDRGPQ